MDAITYYYDDDSPGNHFRQQEFLREEDALVWAEALRRSWPGYNCILYWVRGPEDFVVMREWKLPA